MHESGHNRSPVRQQRSDKEHGGNWRRQQAVEDCDGNGAGAGRGAAGAATRGRRRPTTVPGERGRPRGQAAGQHPQGRGAGVHPVHAGRRAAAGVGPATGTTSSSWRSSGAPPDLQVVGHISHARGSRTVAETVPLKDGFGPDALTDEDVLSFLLRALRPGWSADRGSSVAAWAGKLRYAARPAPHGRRSTCPVATPRSPASRPSRPDLHLLDEHAAGAGRGHHGRAQRARRLRRPVDQLRLAGHRHRVGHRPRGARRRAVDGAHRHGHRLDPARRRGRHHRPQADRHRMPGGDGRAAC